MPWSRESLFLWSSGLKCVSRPFLCFKRQYVSDLIGTPISSIILLKTCRHLLKTQSLCVVIIIYQYKWLKYYRCDVKHQSVYQSSNDFHSFFAWYIHEFLVFMNLPFLSSSQGCCSNGFTANVTVGYLQSVRYNAGKHTEYIFFKHRWDVSKLWSVIP